MGFELPEILKVSKQMEEELVGKKIIDITLTENFKLIFKQGMSNLDKRQNDILNTSINKITPKGKWIFLEFENNNILMLGEIIGKFLYIKKGGSFPPKYHISFQFEDSTNMTFQSSLYAFLTVATREEKKMHKYAGNIGPSPNEPSFSLDYYLQILANNQKKPIKSPLNLQGEISGLGNAYINDILFEANIHPKRKVSNLEENEKKRLYDAIIKVVTSAIELGGSINEFDIYGNPGKYIRTMSKNNNECKKCGARIIKENILGSSSYYCPQCQKA